MATDREIEDFIRDCFASIWDLELLRELLAEPSISFAATELVERMRASELVVMHGSAALNAAGIAVIEDGNRIRYQPSDEAIGELARAACEFYARFPGRTRRLIVARLNPALDAFADAFRWRKD
ncbi:hypothetical protein [Tsuneonella sp. HG222]|nr:MAG: hypothetical protein EOP21_10960 [Hyphomicrobiales bacterium]